MRLDRFVPTPAGLHLLATGPLAREPSRAPGVPALMAEEKLAGRPSRSTPHARLRRLEAVINPASGHVGPHSAEQIEAIAAEFGIAVRVAEASPRDIAPALKKAIGAAPDLVIIVAGDGTARMAADLAGPEGPLIAPLPGGTMNMLPRAIYGARSWQDALRETLAHGEVRTVSGGQIDNHTFYVAAIIGSPALWAGAREAMRFGKVGLAVSKARRALAHAFSTGVHFSLDGGPREKAEALTLICPLISRTMEDETALEAIVLDPHGAGEAVRLALKTMLADVIGDWRSDPAVRAQPCRRAEVSTRGRLPVLLDGEPEWLGSRAEIRFRPAAFRVLAPPLAAQAAPEAIIAP